MSYLVSGASGQLGKEFMGRLGEKAIGFDIRDTDDKKIFHCDLTKKEAILNLLEKTEISGVYHPAAVINFQDKNVEEVNVTGTKNLLEAIVETGKKLKFFVNFSSGGCYGGTPETGAKETDDLIPMEESDPYVKSKLMQEKIAFDYYKASGIPVFNLRPGMIYSEDDKFRWGVHGLIVFGSLGFSQLMIDNGKYKIHCIHSKDMVDAAIYLAKKVEEGRKGIIGESFNVADSTPISRKDFMTIVAEETGSLPPTVNYPEPLVKEEIRLFEKTVPPLLKMIIKGSKLVYDLNPPPAGIENFLFEHHVFDTEKIRDLGWKESVPLREGLRTVIQHKIEQGDVPKNATFMDFLKYFSPLLNEWMRGKYRI